MPYEVTVKYALPDAHTIKSALAKANVLVESSQNAMTTPVTVKDVQVKHVRGR